MFLFQMWLSDTDTVGRIQVWAGDEGSSPEIGPWKQHLHLLISGLTCPDFSPVSSDISFTRKKCVSGASEKHLRS